MKKISKSIRIGAPRSRVFEYVTEPTNLPEIWPSMVEVKNVTREADGGHKFDWVYKMAGIHFNGHAETARVERDTFVESRNSGAIPSVFRWTYADAGEGCELRLDIEYEVPIKLLSKLAEPFLVKLNEREAETLLANLKERMEAQPPKAARDTGELRV